MQKNKPGSGSVFTSGGQGEKAFTMVEMLVVMIVMAIIVAMMMPAFERLAIGSGVDGASRAVGGQLRMARQYAIAQRERVALLMPADNHVNLSSHGQAVMPERQWTAYRACIVNHSNQFVDWVPNTEWQFLPTGAVVAQIGGSDTLSEPPNDNASQISDIDENDDGSVDYTGVRAIIFAPTGRLIGSSTRRLIVVEGAVAGNNLTIRNPDNLRLLEIDTYTGRTSYKDEQL